MAPGQDDSDALLREIAGGSEAALGQFYERNHRRIYAFALRRLDRPVEAAEVLNEVMLEVWRHAGRFEGRAKVQTWVLGIAQHKVLDKLRQRGDEARDVPESMLPLDDTVASPADDFAAVENAEVVRRCLERLPPGHRQVVYLTFYEGLSYREIAEILQCPVGTVKTRMFHAKQILKNCLGVLIS